MEIDPQLSDSEWNLMKVLWDIAPAPVNKIAEATPQWHPKTVRTMLIRLHKKGLVEHETIDGVQHYKANYRREDCELVAAQSFIQRVFDGALAPMVAHFTRQQKLSETDKQALIALLNNDSKKGE